MIHLRSDHRTNIIILSDLLCWKKKLWFDSQHLLGQSRISLRRRKKRQDFPKVFLFLCIIPPNSFIIQTRKQRDPIKTKNAYASIMISKDRSRNTLKWAFFVVEIHRNENSDNHFDICHNEWLLIFIYRRERKREKTWLLTLKGGPRMQTIRALKKSQEVIAKYCRPKITTNYLPNNFHAIFIQSFSFV